MPEPAAPATETAPEGPQDAAQPAETDFKAESRKWEVRAKENAAKLKSLEPQLAELEQLRAANKTEAERQADEIVRWQTEAEQWRTAAVGSTITALAASDFADPSDAAAALSDPARYLNAGGVIDESAIRADLASLLEAKPHWRRQEGTPGPRVPAPNPAQGSSAAGAPASDPAAQFGAILQRQLNGAG